MPGKGEGTPLLRGQLEGEHPFIAGSSPFHQPVESSGDRHTSRGGRRGRLPRDEHRVFASRARSHPVLLAVAAVGAAVLVIAVGFMSTSGTPGVQQAGRDDTSLAATRSTTARGESVESRSRDGGAGRSAAVPGGLAGDGGGRTVAGGGWRSQAKASSGVGVDLKATREEGASAASITGAAVSGGRDSSTSKPNVFFFLIDDMGYGDIGYQSTDLSKMTPNLDALAAGGVKLTSYYTMTLCTPARASIMTGRYPLRYGMQYGVLMPGAPWGLPLNEKILPQYLHEAGYESHMVGKWHLGSHEDAALPSQRGFETYLGYLHGMDTYYSHKNPEAVLDGKHFFDFGFGNATGYYDVTHNRQGQAEASGALCKDGGPKWDDADGPADVCYTGTYSTDAYVGRAQQILHAKTPFDEEPLFLYMAHQSVHTPTGPAPPEGFTPEEQALLDDVAASTGSEMRARFAGVLLYLDKRIGELIDLLEEEGWLENSVIVVASDNGACPSDGGCNYPLRGVKQSMYEGGSKVPAMMWSKSHLPSNVWGTSYDKMMHSTDWLPTLSSAVGLTEISGSAGALDGVDHWDSLKSNGFAEEGEGSTDPRTELLYNWDSYIFNSVDELHEDQSLTQGAFRSGDWKLLVNVWCSGYYSHDPDIIEGDELLNPGVTCDGTGECQDCIDQCQKYTDIYGYSDRLYNIKEDPREVHDLYDQYPKIAKQLRQRAEEVVFSEYSPSGLLDVNTDSYPIWKAQNWWMGPWIDKLPSKTKQNLDGLM